MRIILAAVFVAIGIPLVLSALSTLAAAPSITHRTFAMMQIVAGLLCFLIAVVASLMRPAARSPAEAPEPAPPPAPAGRVRDGLGMALLIVSLAVGLIVLAVQLRAPAPDRDASVSAPVPASGSVPGPARTITPAVTPAGRSEAGRTRVKRHTPARSTSAKDDD